MDHLQGRWPLHPTPLLTNHCTPKEGGANFGLTFPPSYPASLFRLANRQPGTDEELERVNQVLQSLPLEEQEKSLVTAGPVPTPPSLHPQDPTPTTTKPTPPPSSPSPPSQPPSSGARDKSRRPTEKGKGPTSEQLAKRASTERRQKKRARAKHIFA